MSEPPQLSDRDLELLEANVDFRQFSMTVDEYAAALALDSLDAATYDRLITSQLSS